MTRKRFSALENAGVVRKVRKRDPLTFALTASFKSSYGIAAALGYGEDGEA